MIAVHSQRFFDSFLLAESLNNSIIFCSYYHLATWLAPLIPKMQFIEKGDEINVMKYCKTPVFTWKTNSMFHSRIWPHKDCYQGGREKGKLEKWNSLCSWGNPHRWEVNPWCVFVLIIQPGLSFFIIITFKKNQLHIRRTSEFHEHSKRNNIKKTCNLSQGKVTEVTNVVLVWISDLRELCYVGIFQVY